MSAVVDSNSTNENDEMIVSELINNRVFQVVLNVTGAGVEAYANIPNTVGGNLSGRKFLRILNKGKNIIWRVNGQLTGNNGETLGKNEAIEFEYGENIVIQLREKNNDNEIDVIITEGK